MFYIVGTPIGNLKDLSLRQAETIAISDYLLCEDTRTVNNLILTIKNKFKLDINKNQKIESFYKEKEYEKSFKIIKLLEQNKAVSLVSESGMQGISDPGYFLLQNIIKNNIPYSVIPGPTALITGLINSGIKFNNFLFIGFLPKKEKEIIKLINNLNKANKIFPKTAFIFYE